MGRLSTLLKWHAADPPSPAERLRNDRVCSLYQHNRNPFVDRPELVAAIWGAEEARGAPPNNSSASGAFSFPDLINSLLDFLGSPFCLSAAFHAQLG
jgi:hypothetical protein